MLPPVVYLLFLFRLQASMLEMTLLSQFQHPFIVGYKARAAATPPPSTPARSQPPSRR